MVRGPLAYLRARLLVLREERFRVADADPDPRPRVALIALAEKDVAPPARHGREDAGMLPVEREAEHANVVVDARLEVPHAQDRRDAFERDCHRKRGKPS